MTLLRRAASLLLILLILLGSLYTITSYVLAKPGDFKLLSYSYKSSAGTDKIYPGSRNVELTVEVQYVGGSDITGVTGRLQLPAGFTISRGSQASSPPYMPNGTTYTIVKPGDIIIFKYKFDVSEGTSPGSYSFSVNVTYRPVSAPTNLKSEIISGITITVHSYPVLRLNVVDTYWTPDAYPGSEGVSLNVILENDGDSAIVSANILIRFPKIIEPREVEVSIGAMNKKDRVTLTLNNLDVSVDAIPGYHYQATMYITATARTDDGVTYEKSTTKSFVFTISQAPLIKLELLDYGLTAPHSVSGLRYTKIYVDFQNKDTATINAITAIFNITNSTISFINGSRISVTTLQGVYNYGDYITLESKELVINENFTGVLSVELTLTIFGSKDGAEFWSTQKYNLTISVTKPHIDVELVKAYWSTQRVYPGSNDQSLNVVVENLDSVDFIDVVATLKLPPVFTPPSITASNVNIHKGSRTTITFQHIDISREAKPGVYSATLILNGLAKADDNSFYKVLVKLPMLINISSPDLPVFEVIGYGWSEGRAYTTSCNINAYVSLRVISPVTVQNILVRVFLPPQLSFMDNKRSMNITVSGNYGYGQSFRVNVGPINVTTGTPSIVPIALGVEAQVNIHGATAWITKNYIIPLIINRPRLNLTLIDSGWYEGYASIESYGLTAYTTFQSLHIDRISTLIIIMKPSITGVTFESGKNESIWVREEALNYGDIVTATFRDIDVNVNTTSLLVVLRVESIINIGNGYYRASKEFKVNLTLIDDEKSFIVVESTTLYQGAYAPLLPTAHDIILRVTLINIRPDPISSVDVKVRLPQGFKLKGISGSCLNGVAGGSSCTLDLHLDVEDVSSEVYQASIELNYFKRLNNAIVKFTQVITLNLPVEPIETYLPKISLVTWYWGRDTPTIVFEHDKYVPLTIVLINIGRYTAEGVEVKIEKLNSTVRFITNSSYCTARLDPGTTCRATIHLDLGKVSAGNVYFRVYVIYLFREYGVHVLKHQTFIISLPVERFAGGKGLEVVSSDWQNDWPVYPNTQNATFTITLANKWPYRISGLELKLFLPFGFISRDGSYTTTYISGPIDSLDVVTASFTISVGNVTPGRYKAKLIAEYIVECGGAQLKRIDEFEVTMIIQSLEGAIQLISSSWYGGSPEPGTYGAFLLITLRNNYITRIQGPILEIYLPKGFTCAINNETYALISPYTRTLTYMYPSGSSPQQIMPQIPVILRYIAGGGGEAEYTVSQGEILSFIVPLNILTERVGEYYAKAYLNFIDHWGNVRRIALRIPIRLFGSTKLVEVYLPKSIRIINGTTSLSVTLTNKGYAPVYDAYVLMIPQAPIAIPVQNVKYVSRIDSNTNVTLSFNLIYNPTSIISRGGITLQYTSLPIILTIRYKDILGYQHMFNVSAAVLIEPFIDLRLGGDVKAELRGFSLIVSGTIVNYGLSIARSVEVRVIAENINSSTFIGDIDPASQSAFRVEMSLSKKVDRVKIEIICQDDYGREHKKEATLPVKTITIVTVTSEQKPPLPITSSHIIVIVMVAVFLTVVAYLLHRFLKRHTRSHEEGTLEI